MTVRWLILLLMAACGAAGQAHASTFATALGAPQETAVVGSGGLTAALDAGGRVCALLWPGPGGMDQLWSGPALATAATMYSPPGGIVWGLVTDHRVEWTNGPEWRHTQRTPLPGAPIVETQSQWPARNWRVTQTVFVLPQRDVLVCHVEVEGTADVRALVVRGAYAPCTRNIPQMPVADSYLDALNGFAAFVDVQAGAVFHFRPEEVNERLTLEAGELLSRDADFATWAGYGAGVWIGVGAFTKPQFAGCGPLRDSETPLTDARYRALLGPSESFFTFTPEQGKLAATLAVSVARDAETARNLMDATRTQGYSALREETRADWDSRLREMRSLPTAGTLTPRMTALAQACLGVLAAGTDAASGALVRAPIVRPPMSADWPRFSAYSPLAFDLAGLPKAAERLLAFHSAAVVLNPGDAPLGSLPVALRPDGQSALPSCWQDPRTAALFLWGTVQHARGLDGPGRTAYLTGAWPQLEAAGDFLTRWVNPRTREPLPGFDEERLRDVSGPELTITVLTGLDFFLEAADFLGRSRPEWRERRAELEGLARFRCLGEEGVWKLEDAPRFWTSRFLTMSDPRAVQAVTLSLSKLERMSGTRLGENLAGLSVLCPQISGQREWFLEQLPEALNRLLRLPPGADLAKQAVPLFPDTYRASLALITLYNTYAPPSTGLGMREGK